jgi:hypothetical protein
MSKITSASVKLISRERIPEKEEVMLAVAILYFPFDTIWYVPSAYTGSLFRKSVMAVSPPEFLSLSSSKESRILSVNL